MLKVSRPAPSRDEPQSKVGCGFEGASSSGGARICRLHRLELLGAFQMGSSTKFSHGGHVLQGAEVGNFLEKVAPGHTRYGGDERPCSLAVSGARATGAWFLSVALKLDPLSLRTSVTSE